MRKKVEKVIQNCISCILAEKKQGKQEGFLHSIEKGSVPLDTYHVDHMGPLPTTQKKYQHLLAIIDAFTKFVWLYPTKTTSTSEVMGHLQKQAVTFGNPRRIISDRGSAFTSHEFEDYCKQENIQRHLITTGIPRANGQVERLNRIIIPLLTKLAAPKPQEWFKHLARAQQCLNTTWNRSTGTTPFKLLFGVYPRLKDDTEITELLSRELSYEFDQQRNDLRERARENLQKIQRENHRGFNRKRKEARRYKEGDLVAIRRTQRGPGLKLAHRYIGPYQIIRVLRNDRYVVRKVGEHEGPTETSTAVDSIKHWLEYNSDYIDSEDESSEEEESTGEENPYIRGECQRRMAECGVGRSVDGGERLRLRDREGRGGDSA